MIYSVRYQGCDGEYVEETERKLSTRMREHRTSVKKGNDKSALITHNLRTGHTFDWYHIEVVDTEHRRDQRKMTEAIHIRLRSTDINQELGYDLPPIYMPLLRGEGAHHTARTCTLWE